MSLHPSFAGVGAVTAQRTRLDKTDSLESWPSRVVAAGFSEIAGDTEEGGLSTARSARQALYPVNPQPKTTRAHQSYESEEAPRPGAPLKSRPVL